MSNHDHINTLNNRASETIKLMEQNIYDTTNRGKMLEDLNDNAKLLGENAAVFKKDSSKLKCRIIRNNLKLFFVLIFIGTVVLASIICGIVYRICNGLDLSKCKHHNTTQM